MDHKSVLKVSPTTTSIRWNRVRFASALATILIKNYLKNAKDLLRDCCATASGAAHCG